MNKLLKFITCLPIFFVLLYGNAASAGDSGAVTFSVSPPLFKIEMEPGQSWSSFVKVVNNNPYAVTVFTDVQNFKSGETGGVEFIKDDTNLSKYVLSNWISITKAPVIIPSFSSQDVPFSIQVPATADPGGHYAAILLGNKPSDDSAGNVIRFSSKIASLILVKVKGEIHEEGDVTEFSTDHYFNNNLGANFRLKFKNTGNVHAHPEGQIQIFNLFGKDRGTIEVNRSQNFGNVLPESEKKWDFSWQGANGFLDAGLMKAQLSLSYGDESKKSINRTIYFWTIDLKPTLTIIGIIAFIVLVIVWVIKRYIRRSIESFQTQYAPLRSRKRKAEKPMLVGSKTSKSLKLKPLEKENILAKFMNWSLLKKSLITSVVIIVVLISVTAFVYFNKYGIFDDGQIDLPVSTLATSSVETPTPAVATTSAAEVSAATSTIETANPASTTETIVLNGSGRKGLANTVKELLEKNNLKVNDIGTEVMYGDVAAVIKFAPDKLEEAKAINAILDGQGELRQEQTAGNRITILLGAKYK